MRNAVWTWYSASTTRWSDWPASSLAQLKGTQLVSVVIPARNEAATIASVISGIRTELVEKVPLVDELVVIDSDSTDGTGAIAVAAGATVYAAAEIRPDLGRHPGKGEALWKSQFVTTGDVFAFIDADLTQWGPHFVSGVIGPLLADPQVMLVKGFYDRLLEDGSGAHAPQGGRVTELVARPLINLYWPELAGVVQPLAGEWAVRRGLLEQLSVPVGYGIEIAVLIDTWRRGGLPAVAQVDLGERDHAHQSVHDLGLMASQVIAAAMNRTEFDPPGKGSELWQFDRSAAQPWLSRTMNVVERPPAVTVPGFEIGERPSPHDRYKV